jgi:DNA polymerase I-like protein with 3'-5' exonuclease and polymerase domains
LIQEAEEEGIFAYDLETNSLNPRKGHIEGVAFYVPNEKNPQRRPIRAWFPFVEGTMDYTVGGRVIPLREPLDQVQTMTDLRPIWGLKGVIAIRHNGIFDDAFLHVNSGLGEPILIENIIADSMLADYVADERRKRYGLKLRVDQVFGHKMTSYKEAAAGQAEFAFARKKPLGVYACDDTAWTYRLWRWAMEQIRLQDPPRQHKDDWCSPLDDTPGVYSDLEKIFWKIEMKIQRVLMEMEITGCFIDWEWLVTVQERVQNQKQMIHDEIKEKAGWVPNLRSPQQVSNFLYKPPPKGLGLPTEGVDYNENTDQYATGDKAIKHRAKQFPLVGKLLKYRSLGVIDSSFCHKLIKIAQEDPRQRVHARFRQTGTVIGRLSSADPVNLMNQPRDRNLIRKAFCAHLEDDHDRERMDLCLVDADYCIEEGTLISTQRGMIPVESVIAGEDLAVLESGATAEISHLIVKGELPIVEVRTKMGYSLRATELHRVRVVDANGDYVWRRLGELRLTDHIAVQAGTLRGTPQPLPAIEFDHHKNNREITVPKELDETVAELIGYIIGDGTVQRNYVGVVVTDTDEDVMYWCLRRFKEVFNADPYQEPPRNGALSAKVMSKPLADWFRKVGVCKQSLPGVIWTSGERVACALLRGLFEADGSIGKPSNGQRISVSGKSKELMEQVHLLLLSVGIPGVLRNDPQQLSDKPLWTINIPSAYASEFAKKIDFIGSRKKRCLSEYCAKAGYSPSYGSYPNLQSKVRELRLVGEARTLLNNTSSLGRPVSRRLAATLRDSHRDVYESLELYRTEKFGTTFDKVVSVDSVGTSNVYDLSVPGPTTYVSNGFVSHNSQMELRMAAHLAREQNMIEVYSHTGHCDKNDGSPCERYLYWACNESACRSTWVPKGWTVDSDSDPTQCPVCGSSNIEHEKRCRHVDLHQRTAEDVGVKRQLAKSQNFGLLYRMGAPKFCVYAGLHDEDGKPRIEYGQELIEKWHNAYPAIAAWHERVIHQLVTDNYIAFNIARRRRRLDIEWKKNEYRAGTQAIQFRVSGSCQDLIKLAMIRIFEYRNKKIATSPPAEAALWKQVKFLIQVHDELIFECPKAIKDEMCLLVKTSMEGVATGMRIPFVADTRAGRTWDELH